MNTADVHVLNVPKMVTETREIVEDIQTKTAAAPRKALSSRIVTFLLGALIAVASFYAGSQYGVSGGELNKDDLALALQEAMKQNNESIQEALGKTADQVFADQLSGMLKDKSASVVNSYVSSLEADSLKRIMSAFKGGANVCFDYFDNNAKKRRGCFNRVSNVRAR